MGPSTAIVHETPVLVIGSGPVGLITSLQLARYGQNCMLVERNYETTKWPKMDITNCRSMELLRTMGLADSLRKIGVDEKYSFNVLFSSGLGEGGKRLGRWDLPSPVEWEKRIQEQNDGSMPLEPYQRCSQSIFERWLKPICEKNPFVESYFGWKFESLEETPEKVISQITELATGQTHIVHSKFVVACDGAGSRARKSIGVDLIGGPTPSAVFLVHFKSRDLARLQAQGQFWHIFFTTGAAIISQDEVDTWTCHYPVPLNLDTTKLDPVDVIYAVLGGSGGKYPIKVDEILVTSVFRPNLVVANEYVSPHKRVFLAGDSAHQNIPTGGYGMNMGVGDAYDIGWKLAAYLKGYAGETLLQSYGVERRPVALRNVDRSGVHMSLHLKYVQLVKQKGSEVLLAQDSEGESLREEIKQMVLAQDGENKDHGIEMGYRFNDSPVINHDEQDSEPRWTPREYVPSTWPGSRAPHVFLKDSVRSIMELYGLHYTIIDFTTGGETAKDFTDVAKDLGIPLEVVRLPDEPHARKIWERDAVLVRPDGHVAWRSSPTIAHLSTKDSIKQILLVAVGKEVGPKGITASSGSIKFTTSVENVRQDATRIAQLGEFQR